MLEKEINMILKEKRVHLIFAKLPCVVFGLSYPLTSSTIRTRNKLMKEKRVHILFAKLSYAVFGLSYPLIS